MFVALVLGTFGVLLWAVKIRKKRRRKYKHHKRGEPRGERKPNPTLAETGGLPPLRPPEKTPDRFPLA
jgi:hypothetical protein